MKSILVTGGAGYIGSHTCKELARAGYQPITVDNLSTGHRWAVHWGPLVEGDIADRTLVRRTIENYRIEAVIHFAANALVAESMENPYRYLHDNAANSLDLLEAMRETRVRSIVFSSTCATYGMPQRVPISETEPEAPVNPYGESKLYVERALRWYEQIHGTGWVALRYFNAAGADPESEIGEAHNHETHLIPLAIDAALGRRPAVHVMGTDYPTPDGTAIRDYVHVTDLADAHIRAVEHLFRGGKSTALNLGTGRGHSVREVIAGVERAGRRPVPVVESGRRPGDPVSLVADNRRAQIVLGWKPRYADLDVIVGTAWKWHASRTDALETPRRTQDAGVGELCKD
jgi:UDP-arabinose 4-epimerase